MRPSKRLSTWLHRLSEVRSLIFSPLPQVAFSARMLHLGPPGTRVCHSAPSQARSSAFTRPSVHLLATARGCLDDHLDEPVAIGGAVGTQLSDMSARRA